MIKINLLPWREELRKEKQQAFVTTLSIAVGVTVCIFGGLHIYLSNLQDYQAQRNKILQDEIIILEQKIVDIKNIEEQKTRLVNKITVIHNLQRSRPEIVHLFNEIPVITPDALYMTKLTRTGRNLIFEGKSQSNALISAFMSAIENTPWLEIPSLDVITQDKLTGGDEMNNFILRTKQKDLPNVK